MIDAGPRELTLPAVDLDTAFAQTCGLDRKGDGHH